MSLSEQYLSHLRNLPFVLSATLVRSPAHAATDGQIRIKTPTGVATLPFEEKRTHLSEALIAMLVHRAESSPNLLVFAPAVGRGAATALENAAVNYVDLDGNCFLRIGKQYVAKLQGQPRAQTLVTDRALRAPALKVLFALLVERELIGATARLIATQAGGVSPQTANDVRHRLSEQGQILKSKSGWKWADGGRREALQNFVSGYRSTLFPSLLLGRYRARETDPVAFGAAVASALGANTTWRFGGGAACERLTHFYRGEQTLVYLNELTDDIKRQLRLVPDNAGPVAFASSPGPVALQGPDPLSVHPLLVYADLLAENHDRARDAAKAVYQQFVKPLEAA